VHLQNPLSTIPPQAMGAKPTLLSCLVNSRYISKATLQATQLKFDLQKGQVVLSLLPRPYQLRPAEHGNVTCSRAQQQQVAAHLHPMLRYRTCGAIHPYPLYTPMM
jgi:hypothetical protein